MNLSAYCERLGAGFWAEPFNALTNLGFFVAGLAAWRLWRRQGGGDRPALALILLAPLIGAGSFVFHTVPARWSGLADVIPIQLFAFGYFLLATRRFLGLGAIAATLATAAFVIASLALQQWLAPQLPRGARGSAAYASFVVALFATAWLARCRPGERAGRSAAPALALAGAVFALSLALRSIDQSVCPVLPIGTHFVWHLLNAVVVFVLLRGAITAGPVAASPGPGAPVPAPVMARVRRLTRSRTGPAASRGPDISGPSPRGWRARFSR
jgi:hypothetical protein